jgi:hypothetical protein
MSTPFRAVVFPYRVIDGALEADNPTLALEIAHQLVIAGVGTDDVLIIGKRDNDSVVEFDHRNNRNDLDGIQLKPLNDADVSWAHQNNIPIKSKPSIVGYNIRGKNEQVDAKIASVTPPLPTAPVVALPLPSPDSQVPTTVDVAIFTPATSEQAEAKRVIDVLLKCNTALFPESDAIQYLTHISSALDKYIEMKDDY